MGAADSKPFLIIHSPVRTCALPLERVIETMRPLPVRPLATMTAAVRGVSVIRGESVPVIDLDTLLGTAEGEPARYITVRTERGTVALAVRGTVSLARIDTGIWRELPPLMAAASHDAITALGVSGGELTLLLNTMHMVPSEIWSTLATGARA